MDGLKGEIVNFETKDHIVLRGFLARPKKKSDKALIHLHGLEGTFYRSHYADVLGGRLVDNGFNYLSIEQRGSYTVVGFRRKTKQISYVNGGGGFEKFEDCAYDIDGAIRFLRSIGITKIFLEGHSTGCQKVTYYQYRRKDKYVKGIILCAPSDDYNIQKTKLGKEFDAAVKSAKALYEKDERAQMPGKYMRRIFGAGRFLSLSDLKNVESRLFNYKSAKLSEFSQIRQPILAIFGEKDENLIRPALHYMKVLERDTNSKKFDYRIIKGADHGFDGKENQLSKVIVDWLCTIS
jgi:pimeloyl-ACP methyl ester carboxylesterase